MTYKCKEWEKWQSYRSDRGQPPWIKIHRRIMRNHDWADMTDAQRGQLVSIWLLAADKNKDIRDPQKALGYALRSCELTDYQKADYVDTLAVAYAADGQFSLAIETARKALDLAVPAGNENLVDEINKRIELYKANQPYYD